MNSHTQHDFIGALRFLEIALEFVACKIDIFKTDYVVKDVNGMVHRMLIEIPNPRFLVTQDEDEGQGHR